MKVLVIGATGFVGGGIARAFERDVYAVSGLARSHANAAHLAAQGWGTVPDTLDDPVALAGRIGEFDVTVFAPVVPYEDEARLLSPLLDSVEAAGRCLVFTSGTGVMGRPAPTASGRRMPAPWL